MVPLALNSSADILIENVALRSYHCMFFKLKAKKYWVCLFVCLFLPVMVLLAFITIELMRKLLLQ